jgi:hypothetical protein
MDVRSGRKDAASTRWGRTRIFDSRAKTQQDLEFEIEACGPRRRGAWRRSMRHRRGANDAITVGERLESRLETRPMPRPVRDPKRSGRAREPRCAWSRRSGRLLVWSAPAGTAQDDRFDGHRRPREAHGAERSLLPGGQPRPPWDASREGILDLRTSLRTIPRPAGRRAPCVSLARRPKRSRAGPGKGRQRIRSLTDWEA